MRPVVSFSLPRLFILALILTILAACGGAATPPDAPVRETMAPAEPTAVAEATAEPPDTTTETTPEPEPTVAEEEDEEPPPGSFTTPHPILSDVRVRQAIAYCTDRTELIQSVYNYLSPEEQQGLLMDSFVPQGHWALAENITTYPFDPEQGNALLEEAGWTLPDGTEPGPGVVRTREGEQLSIGFVTTDAQFRQTWATVFEQQLAENCSIQIIRTHAPGSWLFGDATGLRRRDFELAAFAWVGEPDPKGRTLYACNEIPLPENNWAGQNYMGWCNETASRAIIAANNTLDRDERIRQYAIFQEEFTRDMVSLPLFQRLEAQAASNNLVNFISDPTEYMTANIGEWELTDDADTIVLGFSQEPSSMWVLVTDAAVATQAADLIGFRAFTKYNYDYQPVALTRLPTIETGDATLEEIEVTAGDMVWTVDAEAVELAPGVEVINADGETVTYAEGDTITMSQLSVTFEYVEGLTWEDGEPVKQADFELAAQINCDPDSGASDLTICNSRQNIDFINDTSYTITYLPGAQWPEYFIYTVGAGIAGNREAYPSHQVLSDGRNLADVPAAEWGTLLEIAERPLSNGPYTLVEWQKGQRLVFEANPNFFAGEPAVPTVIIQIVTDTNQAVAQLLTGDVDVLEKATLGAGPEVQTVIEAGEAGRVQVFLEASPTWEHVDMNLFLR